MRLNRILPVVATVAFSVGLWVVPAGANEPTVEPGITVARYCYCYHYPTNYNAIVYLYSPEGMCQTARFPSRLRGCQAARVHLRCRSDPRSLLPRLQVSFAQLSSPAVSHRLTYELPIPMPATTFA